MFSVSVTLTLIDCKAFVCHRHNGSCNATQGFKEKIKMNIAASSSVCTDAKRVGFPCCLQGWPWPGFQAQRLTDCPGEAEKVALGARHSPPRAGGSDNTEGNAPSPQPVLSKGSNAFQDSKLQDFPFDSSPGIRKTCGRGDWRYADHC